MPRFHESMPSRVWRYGCREPRENRDRVEEQFSLAHRYYNRLIELERDRRRQVEEAVREHAPALAGLVGAAEALGAELAELRKQVSARNAAARRRTGSPEDRRAVKDLEARHKAAWDAARDERRRAWEGEALKARAAEINRRTKARRRELRGGCRVYWGCVDDETQILTRDGWKSRWEFTGTETVATYNLETGRLEWQQATGKGEYPYRGKMARVKNARLDMLLTPNHRIVVEQTASRTDIMRRKVREAVDMTSSNASRIRIPQAAPGLEPETPLDVSPALAAVLGWIIAEGCFELRSDGIIIDQSAEVNPVYVNRIRDALRLAGLSFTDQKTEPGMVRFHIAAASAKRVRALIPDRLLTPSLAFGLSADSARSLFDALLSGDGSHDHTSTGKPRWRWIQKSPANVALFQALAIRLGLATHARPRKGGCYTVSVRSQPYSTWQSQRGDILCWADYEGTVWCPSTPNTTWVARRNGTVFVTGNTYLVVEKAAADAASKSKQGPPRFRRWTGDGILAVQLQKGLAVPAALAGNDTRLRLVLDPDHRSARGQNGTAYLRIGSDGSKPVWAVVDFRLHRGRALPPDARITWAFLVRRRYGTRYRWWLNLTLAREGWPREDQASAGTVAVNLGWRATPDGVRVATWVGDDGARGHLVIGGRDVSRWTKADELRGTRDANFNEVRGRLAAWVGEIDNAPDWLAEETSHVHQWRSQGRLAGLVHRWRERRFDGDGEMFELLEGWRAQDEHLWNWEANNRRKAVCWREKLYQELAARLRRQYREVRLAKVDYRKLAKRAAPEAEDEAARQARFNRTVASPGSLSKMLRQSFAAVSLAPAKLLTQRCHRCGHEGRWDAQADVMHTCAKCGETWDQDVNHCMNLMQWAPPPASAGDDAPDADDGGRPRESA